MSPTLFSIIYIQTTKKQSLWLDNDGCNIQTSDNMNFNFLFWGYQSQAENNIHCSGDPKIIGL